MTDLRDVHAMAGSGGPDISLGFKLDDVLRDAMQDIETRPRSYWCWGSSCRSDGWPSILQLPRRHGSAFGLEAVQHIFAPEICKFELDRVLATSPQRSNKGVEAWRMRIAS